MRSARKRSARQLSLQVLLALESCGLRSGARRGREREPDGEKGQGVTCARRGGWGEESGGSRCRATVGVGVYVFVVAVCVAQGCDREVSKS